MRTGLVATRTVSAPGWIVIGSLALLVEIVVAGRAFAQQPAAPDPGTWAGTAGAGLALTSGNSDTLNFNVAFDATRDPKTRNVMKWTGLYLRGEQNEALVANRLSLSFRDQYALTTRAYTFGQIDYLRDTFKLIEYLVAPTAGVGYKLVDTSRTKFSTDAGLGVVWEKNPERDVRTSMALIAGEKLEHALTATSTLKHAVIGLWQANDLADGLYTFSIGLGTRISEQLQLSIDVLDTFKNRPPTPATKKNDRAPNTGGPPELQCSRVRMTLVTAFDVGGRQSCDRCLPSTEPGRAR